MPQILILSAGRRVSLLNAFIADAPPGVSVAAADLNPGMSAACRTASRTHVLPPVLSAGFPAALETLCREHEVRLVVPTIDPELAPLARLRDRFEEFGCSLCVSDTELVDVCRDKRKSAAFFSGLGLPGPEPYELSNLEFPAFVKPFDGSLSAGTHVLHTREDLTAAIAGNERNIFAEYLDPRDYQEFTCDAYFDRSSTLRCVVPRLRLEVRGGEISKGQTEKNEIVEILMQRLRTLPGARGCLTIQIMRHRHNGRLCLIEVNPRFGGGYPLTARSGAAYHRWLMEEYLLEQAIPDFADWAHGLLMLRYDAEVFIEA